MLFNDFTSRMQQDLVSELNKKLNNNITSELTNLEKLQGQSYTGLSIRFKDSNAGAVYNLSEAFRKLQDGESYSQLLDEAVVQMENALHDMPDIPFDVLCNYAVMKDFLTVQLVSESHNKTALEGIAYKEVADDLALVYRIVLPPFENCERSLLVRKDFLNSLNVSLDQVHQDALKKSSELLPMKMASLNSYIASHCDAPEEILPPEETLWIVTNNKLCLGASALFYPGALNEISDRLGGDFYIIPSSIHECLVCSSKISHSWEFLERMLNEVNTSIVDNEEILSDQLYYYDSISGVVEPAAKHCVPLF